MTSHFERYIYALNEELITFLNGVRLLGHQLDPSVRLLHSMLPIDELGRTGWEHRAAQLANFVAQDGWLWANLQGTLIHDRLLVWMKSPSPANLVRYFRYWGVQDIFTAITKRPNTRSALWLGVQSVVDLRNNIAHGDFASQATQSDVRRYAGYIRLFCERSDRAISRHIARQFNVASPW